MKVYAAFICDRWSFESMECGLVGLWVKSIDVQGKKGECRGNFRASASRQPIDEAKNTLIDLSLTCKIRI